MMSKASRSLSRVKASKARVALLAKMDGLGFKEQDMQLALEECKDNYIEAMRLLFSWYSLLPDKDRVRIGTFASSRSQHDNLLSSLGEKRARRHRG